MAAPFRFGLRRVRDLRAHDEEHAKELFAASLSQRVRGEAMLRSVDARLRKARLDAATGIDVVPLSGAELQARQAWVERLERSRLDAALELESFEHDLRDRRGELTAASQRREVLDQLEARQREQHRLDAARREGAQLDEMALTSFIRRQRAA
jgi:flagellar FliJ protein